MTIDQGNLEVMLTRQHLDQIVHPQDAGKVFGMIQTPNPETGDQYGACVTYGPTRAENELMLNTLVYMARQAYLFPTKVVTLEETDVVPSAIDACIGEIKAAERVYGNKGLVIVNGIDLLGSPETPESPVELSDVYHSRQHASRYIGRVARDSAAPMLIGIAITPRTHELERNSRGKLRPMNPILKAFPKYHAFTPSKIESPDESEHQVKEPVVIV